MIKEIMNNSHVREGVSPALSRHPHLGGQIGVSLARRHVKHVLHCQGQLQAIATKQQLCINDTSSPLLRPSWHELLITT